MSAITPERVQEIRARLEAATPGPWGARAVASEGDPIRPVFTAEGDLVIEYEPTWEPDADLIHNAPTDLADLLDERDRLLSDNLLLRTVADVAEIVAQGFDDDGPTVADIAYLDDALAAAVRAYRTTTGEGQ